MVSDQNKPKSLKLLLLVTFAVIILCVAVVMLYLSFRYEAIAKTQPYSVTIGLQTVSSGKLSTYYNYGYGYNEGHQQSFELIGDQVQTISFTVSAWKKLNSLRINSAQPFNISSVKIEKNGLEYEELESAVVVSQDSPLELADINHKLLGLR